MGYSSRGPGPPWPWGPSVMAALFILLALLGGVLAENKQYHIQSLCKNHFLQQLYRKIDGAVLKSQNEKSLDCVITFQTHSVLQRFMLRFDMLHLDCNDHLYIFDGAHAVGAFKADLNCRNTKQAVGAIFTRTNFVTLKYQTDGWGTESNGFTLVISAVKDHRPTHSCQEQEFKCTQREFCISADLVCDGFNHCGDGSDEAVSNMCSKAAGNTVLGMSMTLFVVIIVSCLLVLCACVVALSVCICRKQASSHPHPAQQNYNASLPCSLSPTPCSTEVQLQPPVVKPGVKRHWRDDDSE